jgi:hypothetical protein
MESGSMALPGLDTGVGFEIRWGEAATSGKMPVVPMSRMIQVNTGNGNTRVVRKNARVSPATSPLKGVLTTGGGGGGGGGCGVGGGGGGGGGGPSLSPAVFSTRRPLDVSSDLCVASTAADGPFGGQLGELVAAMQAQWQQERKQWQARERQLLVSLDRSNAQVQQAAEAMQQQQREARAHGSSGSVAVMGGSGSGGGSGGGGEGAHDRTSAAAVGRFVLDLNGGRPISGESVVDASPMIERRRQSAAPVDSERESSLVATLQSSSIANPVSPLGPPPTSAPPKVKVKSNVWV